MNPTLIPRLLTQLRRVESTATLHNPYETAACSQNLRRYLELLCTYPYTGQLLVGEAPGHRGCALTGIPLTSQRVLATYTHPFIEQLRPSLSVPGDVTESTATIVWDYLAECTTLPAMWNVFPFHPHKAGDQQSNRTPTAAELESGRRFVETVLEVLTPHTVIAVGGKAATMLGRWFPDLGIATARHPSYGGKADFLEAIEAAGVA